MGVFSKIFGSQNKPASPAVNAVNLLLKTANIATPTPSNFKSGLDKATKILSEFPIFGKLAGGSGKKAERELELYLKGKQYIESNKKNPLTELELLKKDKNNFSEVGKAVEKAENMLNATMGAINETGPGAKVSKSIFEELKSAFKKKPSAVSGTLQSAEELAGLARKAEAGQILPSQVVQTVQGGVSSPSNLVQDVDPVKKVIAALEKAKPIRGKQETLYTAERAKRLAQSQAIGSKTSGEAGFYSELGALRGELPKVQFDEIRSRIGQEDIDAVFNKIKDSPLLNEWDKITARKALSKLFGEFGGTVPTENEIALLNKALGPEFVSAVKDKRTLFAKFKELGLQIANIPRSIMASVDMSAPFRQGLFMAGKPKQFFGAFDDMFRAFGSEKSFKAIQEEIVRRPTFELMRDSRLALTDMDNLLGTREEQFMSNLAEKVPVAGKLVRASGRAYTGFLNKLRADVFDDLMRKAENAGLNPTKDRDLVKAISGYINTATGRGSLGAFERAAPLLNSFFFSPRLMASRLSLLNPVYYIKQPSFVRKEMLKNLLTLSGTMLTVLGLAKLAGAEVGTDPRSSDFSKIKINNTRVDIGGGFLQYLVLGARLITGEYVSSTTGKETKLGEGYKPTTRLDILQRGIESKEAPLFSLLTDILRGQDFSGKPIEISKEVMDLFIPLFVRGMVELYQEDPSLLPLGLPSFFGTGVQSYKPSAKKSSGKMFSF